MEITPMEIYWAMQMDEVRETIGKVIALCVFFFFGSILALAAMSTEGVKGWPTHVMKITLALSVLLAPVAIVALGFIPSTATLATMYVLPHIAESDAIREDVPELWDLAVERMKVELEADDEQ